MYAPANPQMLPLRLQHAPPSREAGSQIRDQWLDLGYPAPGGVFWGRDPRGGCGRKITRPVSLTGDGPLSQPARLFHLPCLSGAGRMTLDCVMTSVWWPYYRFLTDSGPARTHGLPRTDCEAGPRPRLSKRVLRA